MPIQSWRGAPHFVGSVIGTILCVVLLFSVSVGYALSVRGSFITLGKGYQDLEQNDHFVLAQGLRFHLHDLASRSLSFHGYFQYYGDTSHDVSGSGTLRFYHGYFQYENPATPVSFRAGRFFLFRGVALGVLDGGELSYRLSRRWEITGFGGVQGNLNREWDFADEDKSPSFGGEIRWRPSQAPYVRQLLLSLSYTHQERMSQTVRELVGLSFSFRLGDHWRALNVVHFRLSNSPLRKALTRWNYAGDRWQYNLEAGIISPDVAAYSWFSDFAGVPILRLRGTAEYDFVPHLWGVGLSALVFGNSKLGFRGGPVVVFPYGRVGYHHSWGDQSHQNVLWGYARVRPVPYLDLYGYAAQIEYQWDAFDVDAQETTMYNVGTTLRPPFLKTTEWRAEWQNYKTPQLDADRRFILGFQWNFGN